MVCGVELSLSLIRLILHLPGFLDLLSPCQMVSKSGGTPEASKKIQKVDHSTVVLQPMVLGIPHFKEPQIAKAGNAAALATGTE